jgi:hypothetical protein
MSEPPEYVDTALHQAVSPNADFRRHSSRMTKMDVGEPVPNIRTAR